MSTRVIRISEYISTSGQGFDDVEPWEIGSIIAGRIAKWISGLGDGFHIKGDIAIHRSARIEDYVTLKGPLIISEDCFIAAHAYLRGGVFLGKGVSIGPGCEVKSSWLFERSALAHFNFIGDSLIGSGVNFEAGSIVANHFNEREDKQIFVSVDGNRYPTGATKFGALVGDGSRIGANAVLSPGSILKPKSIVGRLALVGPA